MGTEASRIQISELLSVIILLQRNYWCFLLQLQIYHVPYIFPILVFLTVSSPVLSKLLEPAPFPLESLVPSFLPDSSDQPDLSQVLYLYRWCPLFRVMIRFPLLVAHSHPLASCDYLAHARPLVLGLSMILAWQPYEPSVPCEAGGHALLFSVPWSEDLHMLMPLPYFPQTLVTTF